ncbi:hypothetical protein AKO1_012658 [Acrasis kona]|uniref:Exonuclease domain-containing protein n=1 Tax=Acrasis kona TaxID=1008807 RepID=A0AAW2YM04_9EUKA
MLVKKSGTKQELIQRICRAIQFKSLKPEDFEKFREVVNKIAPLNIAQYEDETQTAIKDVSQNNRFLKLKNYGLTKVTVMDFETAEPKGQSFYQVSSVSIHENKKFCFSSFAKRGYFMKIPGKNSFHLNANSPEIRNAPEPKIVTEARLRWEEELNAQDLIVIYHARNNLDIHADFRALKEAATARGHHITFLNSDKLIRELLPSLKSCALENLHEEFQLGSYKAHDSLYDCIATWRVLLFALQCTMGANKALTVKEVIPMIKKLGDEYLVSIPIYSSHNYGDQYNIDIDNELQVEDLEEDDSDDDTDCDE